MASVIDCILHNGRFHTVSRSAPKAEAVAITGGRFVAVGSNTDILNLSPYASDIIDLGGRAVLPGFIDSHCHPALAGVQHLKFVECDSTDRDSVIESLRQRVSKTPRGEWVVGFLYDDMKLAVPLTLADLDEVAPHHPLFLGYRGGHSAQVNTCALHRVNIGAAISDPKGGRYFRDAGTGRLSGRIDDAARDPFFEDMPINHSRDDLRDGAVLISRMMSRQGITSVGEAALTSPADLRAYNDAHSQGQLRFRVYCFINAAYVQSYLDSYLVTGFGNEWVRLGAAKQFCDGSISERTSLVSSPYDAKEYCGLLLNDEEELFEKFLPAYRAGWQLATHANGDRAIDKVLRVYERLYRDAPCIDPRFRIEHCTVMTASLLERAKSLNIIPVPFSSYAAFHGEKMPLYSNTIDSMFALRSFLDAGLKPSASSDYTASPFSPMQGLQAMVTRKDVQGKVWGPSQRVTLEEAIDIYTVNGAYASREEQSKGSIEPDKLADLVVLETDPFAVDPEQIGQIGIERTMLNGEWVFES